VQPARKGHFLKQQITSDRVLADAEPIVLHLDPTAINSIQVNLRQSDYQAGVTGISWYIKMQ
jgi:hypothetical protein